jgi:uncharacterized protein (TIGR02246 family)
MGLSVEDFIEIQQLCARYNHAVDHGDGEAFAAMFTEDGTLLAGSTVSGRAALAAFAASVPESLSNPRHIATNIVIAGDAGAATVSAYLQVWARVGADTAPRLVTSGQYDDRVVAQDGGWLFASRVFTADPSA